ncbi:MAG: tetratricopeptide repeat protein [Verrucomicrobiales bacterium]
MKTPALTLIVSLIGLTLIMAETASAQARNLAGLYNTAQRALQNGDYAKAIGGFQNYLDIAKDSKEPAILNTLDAVYYGLGSAYFNDKQWGEAADKLTELLKRFPNSRLVPEVQFFLAQALFFKGDHAKAMEGFKLAEKTPRFRDDSLLLQAEALRKAGKPSEAAEPLGRLVEGGVRSGNSARAALQLAVLSAEQQNAAKAIELLTQLSGNLRFLPNVASFNQAVIVIGDALLNNNKQEEALAVYRLLQNKDSVLTLMDRQIDQLTKLIAARRRQAQTAPDRAGEARADATRYEMLLAEIGRSREEFEKAPDTLPAVLLRLGKAYYDSGLKWESIAAYDELLLRYPDGPDRETAVYALMVAFAEVKQFAKSQQMGEKFIADFPQSDRLEEIRYIRAVTALDGEDPEKAIELLTDLLKTNPATTYKEEVAYLIANARFGMGLYAEARADYEAFLTAFPQSALTTEVSYRKPLCLVFDGKYEDAIKELQEWVLRNPDSSFVTDARYRLMVCWFAAAVNDKTGEAYKKVIQLTEQFEKENQDSPQLADVLALRGDAYAGLSDLAGQPNQDDQAAEAYLAGFKAARNEETQIYNLFEAIKLWQKNSQWDKVKTTLSEFIAREPDHPSAATAKYWIGRSLSRQRLDEEAKQFYATEIKAYMTQPRKDGVEMMISELVRLLAKRKKTASAAAPVAPAGDQATAVATPAPAAPAPANPEAELDALIGGDATLENRTSTARLFLAKALLAQARNDTQMRDTYYNQLGEFEPNELSAYMLGQMAEYFLTKANAARLIGDELTQTEELARADKFSKELLSSYPKSEFIELGYVSQGEVASARGNHEAAYQWFKDAIDVAGATSRMREAVFGQAKSLLALNKFSESKKLFEQVASTREWRGELTPDSIFNLGEIEFRQGRYREANANYQRVYAGYAKYTDVCGRAYLQSAEAFDQLGMRKEAENTLKELLRSEKIPQRHRDAAREKLKSWGLD